MIEDDLKNYIKAKHKSVPLFAEAVGIPYQTLNTIFNRGIENANISNVLKICRALGISVDGLADGRIVPVAEINYMDISTIRNGLDADLDVTAIDGRQLSEQERTTILDAFDIAVEIVRRRR